MSGKSPVIDAILRSGFSESGNTIRPVPQVEEEFVGPVVALDIPGVADIYIQPPIAININHAHTGGPVMGSGHSGAPGHIPKPEITAIQEQLIGLLVGDEVHVRPAITVDISDRHTAAVIIVAIPEDV